MALESFCFCLDLRTGSLFIGFLGLFSNVFLLLLGSMGLLMYMSDDSIKDEVNAIVGGKVSFPIIATVGLLVIILNLVFLSIFLVGMYTYKPEYVNVYIIYYAISILISIVTFLHNIIILSTPAVGVFSELFNILLNIYFLLVIISYSLVMDTEPPRPNMYIPNPNYGQPPMLSGNQGYQPNPNAPPYNMNAPQMPSPPMGGYQPNPNAPPYNMNAPQMPSPPMGGYQPYPNAPPYNMNAPQMPSPPMGGYQPYPNAPPYNMNAPQMPSPPMGGYQPNPNAPPYNMNAPQTPSPPTDRSTDISRPPSPRA